MLIQVDSQDLAAILCGLRIYQSRFDELKPDLLDIATNGGECQALTPDEVDDLCERLNCSENPKVLAIISGGVCQGARSTSEDIAFYVRDYDNEEQDEDNFPDDDTTKEEVFARLEAEDEKEYPYGIY